MSFTHGTLRENAARAPRRSTLAPPFREAWVAAVRAGTLAHDGLLFVMDKQDHVAALDAVTGQRVWTSPWPAAAQLVHDGRLFVRPPCRAELHVVDPRTGHPRSAIFSPGWGERLAVGSRLFRCAEWGEAVVSALDWSSGQRLWTARHPPHFSGKPYACASENALVYGIAERTGGGGAEALVARDPASGAELWRRPVAQLNGIPAIQGDRVVASLGDRVSALALRDGALLWEAQGGGGYLYDGGYHCLKVDFGGGAIYQALDVASGKTLVRVDLLARLPKSLRNARPAAVLFVSESHVFVLGGWNNSLLVFTRDGDYVWNHHPKAAHVVGEVVGGEGRFYYRHPDRLYCIEAAGR